MVQIEGNLTGRTYKTLLQRNLLPLKHGLDDLYEDEVIFQHDNARPHTANVTQDWFDDQQIPVLDWPARSPDLNPAENVFAALARLVYAENRQFDTTQELLDCINQCWDEMNVNDFHPYIDSMPDRMEAVIAAHGKNTRY